MNEKLEKVYMNVIFKIFPIWSDIHGYHVVSDITYSESEVRRYLKELKIALDTINDKYIKRNIKECIYYIDKIKIFNHPYFYVDIVINSILFYKYINSDILDEKKLNKIISSVLERAKKIKEITSNLISYYERIELSYLEVKLSLLYYEKVIKELKDNNSLIYSSLKNEHIIDEFNFFKEYLIKRLKSKKRLKKDYFIGKDKYLEYLKIYFPNYEWDLEKELYLLEQQLSNLQDCNRVNNFSVNENYEKKDLEKWVQEISSIIINPFEEYNFSLKIKNDFSLPSFYYRQGDNDKNSLCNINIKNKNKEECQLLLVHEIYPGHFYFDNIVRNNNIVGLDLSTDRFVYEGWAKFCEEYYSIKSENKKVKNVFNKRKYRMILKLYITMNVHCKHMKLNDIINICDSFDVDKDSAKQYFLSSIINPFSCLYYYYGYKMMKDKMNIKSEISILYQIESLLMEQKIYD